MNDTNKYTVVLFSIDLVFNEIIRRILDKTGTDAELINYTSFSDAGKISEQDKVDLIIVNDEIIGTSSYELISVLRLKRQISCPFIYFGVSEYDGERKALMTGANFFIRKPFTPESVLDTFQGLIQLKKEKA
ncbi:hypothetical protein SDC9_38836 [bioreactor metagenome]|uniref:Response regulatory domain-containing protein n=1 Tax=bioreactor metagenome TaxID=1076179 RepID=A0A644VQM6_9ZZZZ